ncbi:heme-dependent oxidative N-demethylase family protein [Pseudopelagicola sp. nBUS_19]|uniref:heme-dependent oxidative N-demethylase family protein n=1 Tax=Pseudopelagicola sp. nBUS_19 TaxID=3395316 RepID=UPI003EC00E5D
MKSVTQQNIPYDPLAEKSLPGVAPLALDDWLFIDDAYSGQMALRCQLLSIRRKEVLVANNSVLPAARELLGLVQDLLSKRDDFQIRDGGILCPDGRFVDLNHDDPLKTLGQIIQEDLCILEKIAGQHVLTGAVLCFPASWSLSEKYQKPLTAIHRPVTEYDANIARRVQRLFDGVRSGSPLWRKNALWYEDPSLHQPRVEAAQRNYVDAKTAPFLRTERQCILRLPQSDAVIFSIHTFVMDRERALAASG